MACATRAQYDELDVFFGKRTVRHGSRLLTGLVSRSPMMDRGCSPTLCCVHCRTHSLRIHKPPLCGARDKYCH